MRLSAQNPTCDGREPALKVIQVRTQRQRILADLFDDYGPFEGRKPLIPGYMFVRKEVWPVADGVVGFVGLVAVPDLDAFVAAIRADLARIRQTGPLTAYIDHGAINIFGRRLILRGDCLVEQH